MADTFESPGRSAHETCSAKCSATAITVLIAVRGELRRGCFAINRLGAGTGGKTSTCKALRA